jgi:ubiquinone/menaquinone biosynthesis C-methylase UbiE
MPKEKKKTSVTPGVTETDFQIAPCLREGLIAESARGLVAASRQLGRSPWAATLRAWCVPHLFHRMEIALALGEEPYQALNQTLDKAAEMLRVAAGTGLEELLNARSGPGSSLPAETTPVEFVTGEHYGRLFEAFSKTSYWDEPAKLLRDRLERNGISTSDLGTKDVLDAGCGGGRYTVAWKLLGAKSVTGYDISETGLADARRRVKEAGIENVTFDQGNVLQLPYKNDRFDIVYSNGVLHHTADWKKGLHELVRVLKPGGFGFLYLIENPGGLFWDVTEILRVVMKDVSRDAARAALRLIGIPANRVFYMLDHVMAPINDRLTSAEIEAELKKAGAKNIRRLTRGTDFDRVEQIHQKKPYAKDHFGIGENRHVFTK